ncbi:MAG: LysR substrate-binding domain-containing protein [Azospirillaceae bacterium]
MDSDLLRAFVAVVDTGGFGAAGRALGRTQSAVSLQIRRLEDRAGARLLDRTRHSVSLTDDGAAFLPYVRRLLRLEAEALASLGEDREAAPLRLGLSDGQALAYLPGVLPAFHAAFPAVRLEVVCDVSPALVARIAEGRLDLALTMRHGGEGADAVIAHEPLVWVAAEVFRLAPGAPLPLALNPPGCVYRAHALAALRAAGRRARIVYTSSSLNGLDMAVASGLAVTVQANRAIPDGCRVLAAGAGGPAGDLPRLPAVDVQLHLAPGTRSLAAQWLARAFHAAVAARPETTLVALPEGAAAAP